jgi:hypothetical protein
MASYAEGMGKIHKERALKAMERFRRKYRLKASKSDNYCTSVLNAISMGMKRKQKRKEKCKRAITQKRTESKKRNPSPDPDEDGKEEKKKKEKVQCVDCGDENNVGGHDSCVNCGGVLCLDGCGKSCHCKYHDGLTCCHKCVATWQHTTHCNISSNNECLECHEERKTEIKKGKTQCIDCMQFIDEGCYEPCVNCGFPLCSGNQSQTVPCGIYSRCGCKEHENRQCCQRCIPIQQCFQVKQLIYSSADGNEEVIGSSIKIWKESDDSKYTIVMQQSGGRNDYFQNIKEGEFVTLVERRVEDWTDEHLVHRKVTLIVTKDMGTRPENLFVVV